MTRVEGIVNVLKPPGMTSSDVVSDIRKIFHTKRVGHAGTLDPGAAGVLPICLGRATRLFDLLIDKEKEYISEIAFGSCTDTQDSYGRVTERSEVHVTQEKLCAALDRFNGLYMQTAPAYSALKSGGKSLYALARSGQEVPIREREVFIRSLDYIAQTGVNQYLLRVRCSRGTYIRTLCEDIGKQLNACAHMSFLLRTASGTFSVEEAFSIAELSGLKTEGRLHETLISIEHVLAFLPALYIADDISVTRLKNGCTIEADDAMMAVAQGQQCRIYSASEMLGVGCCNAEGVKLKLHLWPPEADQ